MAGMLKFKVTDDLKAIVEHASNNDPALYYGTKIDRSLFLVKDQGVYLMSAGKPGLLRNPEEDKGKQFAQQVVQYADGLNGGKSGDSFDDWYHEAHRICGGDDFAEPLGLDAFKESIDRGAKEIHIKLTAKSITIIPKF